MQKKEKDMAISFVRMISMFLIVGCHVCQYHDNEWAWWLNCGVQIFLFISGLLYGQRKIENSLEFFKKGFGKILIDYYIYLAISIGIYAVLRPDLLSKSSVIQLIFCYDTIKGLGHLWFIATILLCYLFTPLFLQILQKYLREIKASKVIGILVILGVLHVLLEFYLPHFKAAWVICYLLGALAGHIKQMLPQKWLAGLAVCVIPPGIIMNAIQIYQDYFLHYPISNPWLQVLYLRFTQYAHVMLGISLFIILYAFWRILPFRDNTAIKRILGISDNYSYDVYLAHHMWVNSPVALFALPFPMWLRIMAIIVAIGLEAFVIRYMSKTLQSITGRFLAKKESL